MLHIETSDVLKALFWWFGLLFFCKLLQFYYQDCIFFQLLLQIPPLMFSWIYIACHFRTVLFSTIPGIFLQVFMDICLADPLPLMQAELSDAGHGASSFTVRYVAKCPSQQLLRALQSENRQHLQLDKGSIFCSLILQFLSVQQGICVKHQTILVNKFQQNDRTLIIHLVQ